MDLVQLIDHWGLTHPDRAAHISGPDILTYGGLRQQSDKLATFFSRTLPADQGPVAILGHKQNELLIGFMGSIKSGHPYIPLDSSLPAQRVQNIVETAKASLFSVEQLAEILADDRAAASAEHAPLLRDDTWYIIFTSGSTGDPKGVMITRGCLESFVGWTVDEQGFKHADEVFLNQAPFSFDLSVMDLYCSLAAGGTLFSISQDEIAEPRRLFETLGRSDVSVWVSTPSFARMCVMQPTFARVMLPKVRKFWFCGETLAPDVAAELLRRFPGAEVWNTYGPTEATVATTSMQITEEVLDRHNPLPVGRVKPGSRIVIYDENDHILESGRRGEIVIAGPNVGLGYVHRPDLTERAFFDLGGQRAYRTGDAGHFEGDLVFFEGRMDFQIKLHGYRIELGDIESNLHKLTDIQDAVVLPAMRNGQAEYLVAFAILKGGQRGSDFDLSQRLRQELAEHLPDYMVPRKFVFLHQFPTTANGKVDRQQLARTIL
ncbi:MAG: D-alanine--poly(phosphoribitol) ligase subunit DltA [Chloroflexota bacterium]